MFNENMNVAVTNVDTKIRVVISQEEFKRSKGLFSENSIYEYTLEPVTKITERKPTDSNYKLLMRTVAMMYRGKYNNEANRTTTI